MGLCGREEEMVMRSVTERFRICQLVIKVGRRKNEQMGKCEVPNI